VSAKANKVPQSILFRGIRSRESGGRRLLLHRDYFDIRRVGLIVGQGTRVDYREKSI